jgi:nucleotide-binding universal stress UspA family protein
VQPRRVGRRQLAGSLREVVVEEATGADAEVEALAGGPPHVLRDLGNQVDLLVIGSRRWGAAARVLLGGTGEMLVQDAGCAVVLTPRPGA